MIINIIILNFCVPVKKKVYMEVDEFFKLF